MFARRAIIGFSTGSRAFSTSTMTQQKLRIAVIPEHFSTPIYLAKKHYGLDAELIPEPLGTGALTQRLRSGGDDGVDVAVGLTEGFVADLGKAKAAGKSAGYGLVGTYVETPLCWAISTGAQREDINSVGDLKGGKIGVSRIGSGSFVMPYVLADQQGWLGKGEEPFSTEVIGNFAALRESVRKEGEKPATDGFMWEIFTTKHFYDNGELKRIGEIYTPWPSWMVAARDPKDERLQSMAENINQGVKHYLEHPEEAIEHITGTMHYSREDAQAWMKTVKFVADVRGVDPGVVDNTVSILRKAGVLDERAGGSEHMVAIKRVERANTS